MDERYVKGVEEFLAYAFKSRDSNAKIACPCKNCNNFRDYNRTIIESHLRVDGIARDYETWVYHGELIEVFNEDVIVNEEVEDEVESDDDELDQMLHEYGEANWGNNWMDGGFLQNDISCDGEAFVRLVDDAKKDLYPGCKRYTKLSFVVNLLHLKTMSGWSIKSFDALLGIFKKALPKESLVPKSFYEAKKLVRDLGFKYEKIDACVNDCVLYCKDYVGLDKCPNVMCGEPRYKECGKIPRKVLRYFPLKQRLRRMFIHKETASDLRWHKEKRMTIANTMRHPADSEEWKKFDDTYPEFAMDPRNLRLGLSTDGFNPFGNMSNSYSIWPVYIVPYNLPPWKCMKDPFMFLTMIIPGPKSPGNDIDVFLQPLIDELIDLWNGIDAFDAHKSKKFTLRASLLWTINDFPAYAMLSGYSTKGYLACPICMNNTHSERLPHSKKICYMGHRRFLPHDHEWRKNKNSFNGNVEVGESSVHQYGRDFVGEVNTCGFEDMCFGKSNQTCTVRKRKRKDVIGNWTKKSVFFELPYWKDLKVRHNIDIMHVVKNVGESLIGTMMDVKGKTKDTSNSREDLMKMGLKKELHLVRESEEGRRFVMPMGSYQMTKEEKKNVNKFLLEMKYPDGFASNVSRCIKGDEFQLSGMKSHDYHIFMQRVLPVAIRGSMTNEVRKVFSELSMFVKRICARTTYVNVLEEEERNIALILCKLEKMLPPSFFDVMVHLMVHLPVEAKLAGPCQFRWMYPFERKMGTLKGYVSNKARPEGCIAERYIDKECLSFCSMYLHDVETVYNRVERNDRRQCDAGVLSVFSGTGRTFGGGTYEIMESDELKKIHLLILKECDELEEYINEHKWTLEEEDDMNVEERHDEHFTSWFEKRVSTLGTTVDEEIRALSKGLDNRICRYSGCMVNGYRFHTVSRDKDKKTQNSGVMVKGDYGNNTLDFYGTLQDIVEVQFLVGGRKVILFKCDWWKNDSAQCIRVDESIDCTTLNLSTKWYADQPYVLANHVNQVFYLKDLKLGGKWHVIQQFSPRSVYDVAENLEGDVPNDVYQEEEPIANFIIDLTDEVCPLARDSLPINYVDVSSLHKNVAPNHPLGGDDDNEDLWIYDSTDEDAV